MGSLDIEYIREQYAGKSDSEAARLLAEKAKRLKASD